MAHSSTVMKLYRLQGDRDVIHEQMTTEMFNGVPNVVEALTMMLDLPEDDIKWVEFEMSDDVMVLGIAIKFSPHDIPMFVEIFAPHSMDNVDPDVDVVKQLIRVGLPLEYADKSPKDIIQFFHDLAPSISGDDTDEPDDVTGGDPTIMDQTFNTSQLTEEQTQKLLLFQTHTSGVKH